MRGFVISLCAALAGFVSGLVAALLVGAAHIFRLPAFDLALSRAILVARYVFNFLQSIGGGGFQILVFSIGVGIFLNNCMVAAIILLSPIPIFKAKSFSDRYLGRLYKRYSIWLFKPIGWKTYRILAAILPLYALGLQFYLIGGTALLRGFDLSEMGFLVFEVAAITSVCLIAILPSLSQDPLEYLPRYFSHLKIWLPIALATLLVAGILESYELLSMA